MTFFKVPDGVQTVYLEGTSYAADANGVIEIPDELSGLFTSTVSGVVQTASPDQPRPIEPDAEGAKSTGTYPGVEGKQPASEGTTATEVTEDMTTSEKLS